MKRSLVGLVLTLLMALAPTLAAAEDEVTLSPEALEIANALNCPVCQGQSVRDSNSQLARQMRQVIQQKLDAGESRQQVMDYFVERYGVSILREPPKSGIVLALWWVPLIALAAGILILAGFLLQRRGREAAMPPWVADSESESESETESELRRYEELLRQELPGLERSR